MQTKVDYLIVGFGIAGVCFAKKCLENKKSFHIITDKQISASHVAAGLFNPIVIKRFNPVWRAEYQMNLLKNIFSDFEKLLGGKYLHEVPVYRVFSSKEEVFTWQNKIYESDLLPKFLDPTPIYDSIDNISSPFGFGKVLGTGWVDISSILNDFSRDFSSNISVENFDFAKLKIDDKVSYNRLEAKQIIFSEGIKVLDNPYFNFIPIRPNKGETLILKIKDSLPKVTFNSKNFLMPLGDDKYYVGSTYDREWEDVGPTEHNKAKLIKQLKFYYKGDFEILEHRAAFRPTTPNMRPIVGIHPNHPNMYVLNGMGTRGTFNAPDMSNMLFNNIENGEPLNKEINVSRYYKLFDNKI